MDVVLILMLSLFYLFLNVLAIILLIYNHIMMSKMVKEEDKNFKEAVILNQFSFI
jgi:predicted membrane protein